MQIERITNGTAHITFERGILCTDGILSLDKTLFPLTHNSAYFNSCQLKDLDPLKRLVVRLKPQPQMNAQEQENLTGQGQNHQGHQKEVGLNLPERNHLREVSQGQELHLGRRETRAKKKRRQLQMCPHPQKEGRGQLFDIFSII